MNPIGPVVTALFTIPLVIPANARASQAELKPCSTTGVDPTKTAVHLRRGQPKKLKQPENSGKLFGKRRPDRQREDQERNQGEIVRIAGFSTTVVAATFQQSAGEFEDAGYLKATAKICNRNDEAQSFSFLDWRLLTPSGQIINPEVAVRVPTLSEAPVDLVKGGEVSGDVYFEIGGEKGDFYVIYKPEFFDASRGIWKVTV